MANMGATDADFLTSNALDEGHNEIPAAHKRQILIHIYGEEVPRNEEEVEQCWKFCKVSSEVHHLAIDYPESFMKMGPAIRRELHEKYGVERPSGGPDDPEIGALSPSYLAGRRQGYIDGVRRLRPTMKNDTASDAISENLKMAETIWGVVYPHDEHNNKPREFDLTPKSVEFTVGEHPFPNFSWVEAKPEENPENVERYTAEWKEKFGDHVRHPTQDETLRIPQKIWSRIRRFEANDMTAKPDLLLGNFIDVELKKRLGKAAKGKSENKSKREGKIECAMTYLALDFNNTAHQRTVKPVTFLTDLRRGEDAICLVYQDVPGKGLARCTYKMSQAVMVELIGMLLNQAREMELDEAKEMMDDGIDRDVGDDENEVVKAAKILMTELEQRVSLFGRLVEAIDSDGDVDMQDNISDAVEVLLEGIAPELYHHPESPFYSQSDDMPFGLYYDQNMLDLLPFVSGEEWTETFQQAFFFWDGKQRFDLG